ncbi:MAG: serine hydrolase domain-containing protein [Pseudomonadota bacterium]
MGTYINRRSTLKLGGGLLITACSGGADAPSAVDTVSWIPDEARTSRIRAAMEKYRVPGVSIAVVEDGEFVWQGNYGVANIETGTPIDDKTLFQAASLTKPLFAYVVLRLVDAGQIDFDERLVDTFRPHDLADTAWNETITVRHVLTHQTGLPNWRSPNDEGALLEAAYEPGTGYSYSGEAFHWLQQVCETKTGLGLHALTDAYLFTPAGLTDMSMLWLADRADREVYGHIVGADGEAEVADLQFAHEQGARLDEVSKRWDRPMRIWAFEDIMAAHADMRPHTHPDLAGRPLWRKNRPGSSLLSSASSLRTTPADYARFIALVLRNTGPAAISEGLKTDMLSTHTDIAEGGPNRPVGLSWSLERVDGGVAFDHWGFNAGQHISSGLGDTARRKGLVIMTNGAQGNKFMDEIGPVITGIPYRSYV